jgi:chromosome segregation ATPase
MSEGRLSASASLQSSGSTFFTFLYSLIGLFFILLTSFFLDIFRVLNVRIVGATSAEELAEKYQKLFSEHSRVKAQHSVLKKAVIREQQEKTSLQEECKTKEQELRTSLQQLDLLNFHNERLTKRIQSLQDSGSARLSPWLLGSAKKELEKLKSTLETTNIELVRKIEENEKLHKELYEVNSLFTQHVNVLQTKISDLEKKSEELQVELTRSHLASEEALSTMRQEKREVEVELDQTRAELRITKALMEKNEQKLKEGDDALRSELIALRQTLSINLGLADETQSEQFNALSEKVDSESREIIESFKQLQFSTREYLNALKENSDSSYELSVKVRNASQAWQKNLQNLAIKLTSAQNKISELAAENESLTKKNESGSNKVSILETEISRLREELQKLQSNHSQSLNDEQVNTESFVSEQNNTKLNNGIDGFTFKSASQSNSFQKEKDDEMEGKENGAPISNPAESEDEEDLVFVYPTQRENVESPDNEHKELASQSVLNGLETKSNLIDDDATGSGTSFLALERDDMSVRKEDDAKQRENLIKNHYECKITQLKEKLQLSDSRAVRLDKALIMMKSKLADLEKGKSQADQEISKLQKELNQSKETLLEERNNHKSSIDTMTDWIQMQDEKNKNLEKQLSELKPGPSNLRDNN